MRTLSKTAQPTYGAFNFRSLGTKEISGPFEERAGKKSFLVFRYNKYVTVPTDTIAFFYVKTEYSIIACFDQQEYFVNYSLEHIQNIVSEGQFFRLNRQYLVNFDAVKEVEHYFARKLLVNLIVPVTEKLVVSKEKAKSFLRWLENR